MEIKELGAYLFMILACICVGTHIFSFKYIQKYRENKKTIFIYLAIASFLIWCLSRFFIYNASYKFDIVFLHLLLNMSVFVTFALSVLILKNSYNMYKMVCGLILAIFGLYLVKTSTIEK